MQNTNLGTQPQNRLSIGKAAKYLGVSIDTLRRWEKKGVITAYRSPGGHRYFLEEDLDKLFNHKYTRVEPAKKREKIEEPKPKVEKVQVQEEATIAKPLKIESPYPEEDPISQKSGVLEPEKVPASQPTTQQSVPVQDTPPSITTIPYQSVTSVPAAGVEQRAQELVQEDKERNIPWGTIIIVGLIVFVVIDIILFIFYLTSTRTPISSIP